MYPFLRDDDLVAVKEYGSEKLTLGSILVFKGKDGGHIIHRLVKKGKDDFFCLRGDGFNLSTDRVDKEAIIGKVVGIIRRDKFVRFNRVREWCSWIISYPRRFFIRIRKKIGHGF